MVRVSVELSSMPSIVFKAHQSVSVQSKNIIERKQNTLARFNEPDNVFLVRSDRNKNRTKIYIYHWQFYSTRIATIFQNNLSKDCSFFQQTWQAIYHPPDGTKFVESKCRPLKKPIISLRVWKTLFCARTRNNPVTFLIPMVVSTTHPCNLEALNGECEQSTRL